MPSADMNAMTVKHLLWSYVISGDPPSVWVHAGHEVDPGAGHQLLHLLVTRLQWGVVLLSDAQILGKGYFCTSYFPIFCPILFILMTVPGARSRGAMQDGEAALVPEPRYLKQVLLRLSKAECGASITYIAYPPCMLATSFISGSASSWCPGLSENSST